MIQKIKNFLKRFLPPPVKAFNREIERILAAIQTQRELIEEQNKTHAQLLEIFNKLFAPIEDINKKILELDSRLDAIRSDINLLSTAQQQEFKTLHTDLVKKNDVMLDHVDAVRKQIAYVSNEAKDYIGQVSTLILDKVVCLPEKIEGIDKAVSGTQERLAELQTSSTAQLLARIDNAEQKNESSQKTILAGIDKSRTLAFEAKKHSSEAVWASIFNNAITDSSWLQNKTFYPGRWAVGYQALYVMYRVLNEFRPKHILELGLGQSTRMIAQYVSAHENVEHYVVEHDPEWISFFENDFELSDRTQIVQLDREFVPYKEAEAVRVFKDFHETFSGKKFDFIFIDAPLGGDMKVYARVDALSILPECLEDDFVIMVDDAERPGEKNTLKEIQQVLNSAGIDYSIGNYSGEKSVTVFCDRRSSFLTTM